MPNPYHDAEGKFCSRNEMVAALKEAEQNLDFESYYVLRKGLEAADVSSEEIDSYPYQHRSPAPSRPLSDHDSYIYEWDESAYLGQYISTGDTFLYQGEVYVAQSWEWNRAVLWTVIEARVLETGEPREITINQGSEHRVKFRHGINSY